MYKTNIKFTNITGEPEVRDYIEKKLTKIAKIAESTQDETIFRIEVGKISEHHQSGNVYRAEIQVHMGGKDFRVEREQQDVYSAIDEAQQELWQDIENAQKKETTLLRKGGRMVKDIIRRFYK